MKHVGNKWNVVFWIAPCYIARRASWYERTSRRWRSWPDSPRPQSQLRIGIIIDDVVAVADVRGRDWSFNSGRGLLATRLFVHDSDEVINKIRIQPVRMNSFEIWVGRHFSTSQFYLGQRIKRIISGMPEGQLHQILRAQRRKTAPGRPPLIRSE